jgi:hypothetical protein
MLLYYYMEKQSMTRDKESIAEELKYMYYTWLTTPSNAIYERELNDGRYQGAASMAEWTGMFTSEEIKQLENNVISLLEKTRKDESK